MGNLMWTPIPCGETRQCDTTPSMECVVDTPITRTKVLAKDEHLTSAEISAFIVRCAENIAGPYSVIVVYSTLDSGPSHSVGLEVSKIPKIIPQGIDMVVNTTIDGVKSLIESTPRAMAAAVYDASCDMMDIVSVVGYSSTLRQYTANRYSCVSRGDIKTIVIGM